MKIKIFQPEAIYEIGKRQNQEDAIYPPMGNATENDMVYVLCDGMGGHERGEIASNMVCKAVSSYICKNSSKDTIITDDIIHDAIEAAQSQLDELGAGGLRKPGTTIAILCLHKGGVIVAHIGDSRIYHIRPIEHRILYKSRDHSLVYDLFMAGEITFDEIETFNRKNVITRALMPQMESIPKVDIVHITDVCSGDYFYLCSDGMLEHMKDQELVDLLCQEIEEKEKMERLVEETKENRDNHTAYLLRIAEVESENKDEKLLNDESQVRCNAILLENEAHCKKKEIIPSEASLSIIGKIRKFIKKCLKKHISDVRP